jgi:hypothetical protein
MAAVLLVASMLGESTALALDLPEKTKAAQAKLQRDPVSLSIFHYLGKTYCLDTLTEKKPGILSTEYGILYNQLYPLPRLISETALRDTFSSLQKGVPGVGGYGQKSSTRFVDPIAVCTRLYDTGPRSAKAYRAMVGDPKSLHSNGDVDLQRHIHDYLEGYFVKAPR